MPKEGVPPLPTPTAVRLSEGGEAPRREHLLAFGAEAEGWKVDREAMVRSDAARLLLREEEQLEFLKVISEEQRFRASEGTVACARASWTEGTNVAIIGVESRGSEEAKGMRRFGEVLAKQAKACRARTVQATVMEAGSDSAWNETSMKGFALGAIMGCYEDERFKTKPAPEEGEAPEDPWRLETIELALPKGCSNDELQRALEEATAIAKGAQLARGLVSAPANYVTPTQLARTAQDIAREHPDTMTLKVLEKEDCERLGMGSYLAVAEASEEPPKFIHLTYTPRKDGEIRHTLGVVGKGLTFDSGGYNIKAGPGSMIELMKFDMGGAAATLGAAQAVAELEPPHVEVHFIIAACENMVSGKGMRPGDILTASNGKTIEVNNTDAEGRLTLADALVYAEGQGVERCLDIATLTGACIVALGDKVGGMFTQDDEIASSVTKASGQVGERFWRMPMEPAYKDQLKSLVADMKNTGGRAGGSITAALFLSEFVKKMKWAHLDIAGPVWDEKQGGATGFGAATLAQWVLDSSKEC